MSTQAVSPPACVAFIGLGAMGLPMARRLLLAGFRVVGVDPAAGARMALTREGGSVADSAAALGSEGLQAVVTMLPNSAVVREALIGSGLAARLAQNALVVDMSSSKPTDTVALADDLAAFGLAVVDAPVSGGVRRAIDGGLAIMAGGAREAVERARPMLSALGTSIIYTGPIGSGHAMKALNNYISAAGLVAACEALRIGERFGIDANVMTDVLNVSTGRNNSTEVKLKPFIISRSYDSGFAMALMAKDLGIAAELAQELGFAGPHIGALARFWSEASEALGPAADHTEIDRYIAGERAPKP